MNHKLLKILRSSAVFITVTALTFLPFGDLIHPYLPDKAAKIIPKTEQAQADIIDGGGDKWVIITVASVSALSGLWPVPADWNPSSNSIQVIGAGGTGGDTDNAGRAGGGGGGGYGKITNLSFAPASSSIPFNVGAGGANPGSLGRGGSGGHTWFGKPTFAACNGSGSGLSFCVSAEGGEGGTADDTAVPLPLGGNTGSASGTVEYAGGNGGSISGATDGSSGGGGAGGPITGANGTGKNGGTADLAQGSGGGGAGGGSSSAGSNSDVPTSGEGGNGGNGYGGTGGGEGTTGAGGAGTAPGAGGAGGVAAAGGQGAAGTQWLSTFGSGGGGGGAGDNGGDGGLGGLYGGGGGGGSLCSNGGCTGGDGIIVIKYTPVVLNPDLSWDTGATDFEIWAGATATSDAVNTWDNGTLVCATSLTDDNSRQSTCGSLNKNQKYRVQTVLKNVGEGAASMAAGDFVDHKNVKTYWAGTSPTISASSDCGFNDFGTDDTSATCNVAFSGNDVRITNTGTSVQLAATTGTEGFMYLITTDSDVPPSNASTYMNASIDSITEDSSRIVIGQKRTPGIRIRGGVTIRGAHVKFR
ncbi:MAG: hypothetical protein AAB864_02125 [Patescibacteria group bacterium]